MEKINLITNSAVDLGDNLEAESNGKGRKFVSRFIEAGVAHYEQFGDVLITKETLNKFIHTMVGCPVIIKHKDITDKNADKERVGVVSDVWYNENDGYFYCSGIIWDKQAIDLVKNQGWSVSCTYDFESDKQEKTHNGKKIDMEFTDGEFLHLALVDNPRYERANIVMNSKVENEDHWITVGAEEGKKGTHILVKDGETNKEATERKVAEWESKDGKKDKKEKQSKEQENRKTQANYGKEVILKDKSKKGKIIGSVPRGENPDTKEKMYLYEVKWDDGSIERIHSNKVELKDTNKQKKPFNIPSITQSLKQDYEAGKISAHEVAEELSKANLTPYIYDDKDALKKIGIDTKAQNAFKSGLETILDDYKPIKEDLPILNGLKDILGE